jgi:hypothetical protein
MSVGNRDKNTPHSAVEPPSTDQLKALARMVEYASLEARDSGLFLTAHLLDLAGWSLQEARANVAALRAKPMRNPRPLRAPRGPRAAFDSGKVN